MLMTLTWLTPAHENHPFLPPPVGGEVYRPLAAPVRKTPDSSERRPGVMVRGANFHALPASCTP